MMERVCCKYRIFSFSSPKLRLRGEAKIITGLDMAFNLCRRNPILQMGEIKGHKER